MIRSRKVLVAGIFLLAVLSSQVSFAAKSCMGDPESCTKLASNKLWRGVVNTFTGVGEIIRQPIVCTKTDGAVGIPVGLVNGVFMSFVRTGVGIVDVVTFPVPFNDDIGYNSLLNPAYVWQKAK
ncbi:MAG TPA: exosortase system-associated protein, TIGR04073 family [Pontiellaceae bacterium]|nr:exosortase system-associated protein, TIGR04073 family [Pontiellaceae bacterium]